MRRLIAQVAPMIRWAHALQAAAYTLVGGYLAVGTAGLLAARSLRAALVVGLVVAFGFVVNDYFDVEVDRLSKPERPIPSGRTSRRVAGRLAVGLALAALLLTITLGPLLAGLALVNLLLCTAYAARLKNTVLLGNATMALLDATIVLYGSMAAGSTPQVVWLACPLFFLFFFAYEVLKTTADHVGDARARLRTVATQLGARRAVQVFQVITGAFVVAAVTIWATGLAPTRYLIAILLCSVLPTLAAALIVRRTTDAHIALGLRLLKLVWLTSWLPIALLR